MTIRLSDKEASILLGATLMHWGVPFHQVAKRELNEEQQTLADEVSDKLISLRELYQRSHAQEAEQVLLSDEEAAVLVVVVEDCLDECYNDPTELQLQLKTSEREEVETLLQRIRATPGTRLAKLV